MISELGHVFESREKSGEVLGLNPGAGLLKNERCLLILPLAHGHKIFIILIAALPQWPLHPWRDGRMKTSLISLGTIWKVHTCMRKKAGTRTSGTMV
jgi:hypothetical protein